MPRHTTTHDYHPTLLFPKFEHTAPIGAGLILDSEPLESMYHIADMDGFTLVVANGNGPVRITFTLQEKPISQSH